MIRIIAKLDVKPPNVVKPVHFEGLRKMGNPSELAKKYYDQGADELFYIDIVASLYRREILFNDIERVALDMPQLLERKIKDSNKVNMFPVHEYWLDIGQTEQLHQAQKDVSIL